MREAQADGVSLVPRLARDRTDALARPIVETDTAGNAVRYFVWANGRLLAQVASNNVVRVPHFDEMARLLAFTDNNGTLTDEYAYQPYGRLVGHSGATDTPFTWLGAYGVWYAGNGLYLTPHRAYDANFMRFLETDPLGIKGGENLYWYGRGNPASYVDPLGLDVWIETAAVDQGEPSAHQSLAIGDPNGFYRSYSFGLDTHQPITLRYGLTGKVYEDFALGGTVVPGTYYKTSLKTDVTIVSKLQTIEDQQGPYRVVNSNCRTWSQTQHEIIADELTTHHLGTPAVAPARPSTPFRLQGGISSSTQASRYLTVPSVPSSSSSDSLAVQPSK